MSFLWWPRWLISCPVIPIRIWDFLHSTVLPNNFLSRIIYVTPLPIWTLPACRDRATLRLEHSSKFYSWWQQWHKQRTLYPIESVTEYDDLTWNTSTEQPRSWAFGIFWLAQLKHPQEHSLWNTCWGSHPVLPRKQDHRHCLSVNASLSTTDHLLLGLMGGISS